MFLVCLLSLPFLSINTDYLLSNLMRVVCSGTMSVSLFVNSSFIILKCDRAIPVVHAELCSLSSQKLRNWTWNMCAMINCSTVIKHNICSHTYSSICTFLPDGSLRMEIYNIKGSMKTNKARLFEEQ